MARRTLQPYRGTTAWLLQRISALLLVFLVPLKMYTGYALAGKVPWFKSGSPDDVHVNTVIDVLLLFCIVLHALYGIRVMLVDVGWIREDRFFWRTTALAVLIFGFCTFYLYRPQ
jgi:succinate dehydrogenase hydrophobic anchor subunit